MIKLKNVVRPERSVFTAADAKIGTCIDSDQWEYGPYTIVTVGVNAHGRFIELKNTSTTRWKLYNLGREVFLV
jgi:hypothetical protein